MIQGQKQTQTVKVYLGDVVKKKKKPRRRVAKKKSIQEAPPTRFITQYVQQFPPSAPVPIASQQSVGTAIRLPEPKEESSTFNPQARKEEVLRQLEEAMKLQPSRTIPKESPPDIPSLRSYQTPVDIPSGSETPLNLPEETPLRKRLPPLKEESSEKRLDLTPEKSISITPQTPPTPEDMAEEFRGGMQPGRRIFREEQMRRDATNAEIEAYVEMLPRMTVKQLQFIAMKNQIPQRSKATSKRELVDMIEEYYRGSPFDFIK